MVLSDKLRSRAQELENYRRGKFEQELLLEAADYIDLMTRERQERTTARVRELYPYLEEGTANVLALAAAAIEQNCDYIEGVLTKIKANAEDWHGPEPDMGHVRALAVIAQWCNEALGRLEQ
jgi:hypothetical protein